jgi:hypothetical protein
MSRVTVNKPALPGGAMTNNEMANMSVKALRGLLRIAKLAMPESYFNTDSRVRRAQRLLVRLGHKEVR